MRKVVRLTVASALALGWSAGALADTSDVTWQNRVTVAKMGGHCADDPNCFNRYHPAIAPVARAKAGDVIVFETRDALDSDLALDSVADDVTAVDLNLVHPMTGPVFIEGAAAGDALAVTLLDIAPDEYGYTVIVPGFGFLRDLFTEPYIVNWQLDRQAASSAQMPGIRVPMAAFMGSVGVLPGDTEVLAWLERERAARRGGRRRPAAAADRRAAGGGLRAQRQPSRPMPAHHPAARERRQHGHPADADRHDAAAALLHRRLRPVRRRRPLRPGRRRGLGHRDRDGCRRHGAHRGAQGQGSTITSPHFAGGEQLKAIAPERFYATVGFPFKAKGEVPAFLTYLDGDRIGALENLSEDLTLAARTALIEMIDWLEREQGLTREQAYILCSVAVDLVVGQVVDVPNYTVSAIIDLEVFETE